VRLRNEHLQYVVTWYGLALVLAAVFALWARSSFRSASEARESGISSLE
jgi:cytochrome oxidase assembly protein ShyY1